MCTSFWLCSSPNKNGRVSLHRSTGKSELLRAMSSLQFLMCKSRKVTAGDNTPHHPQGQRTRSLSGEEGCSAVSLSRTQDSTHLSQTGWGLRHPWYFRNDHLLSDPAQGTWEGYVHSYVNWLIIYNKNEMRWCVENHFETNNEPTDLIPKFIRQIKLKCKLQIVWLFSLH